MLMGGSMEAAQKRTIRVGDISIDFVWFDSMGAKCSSILVETPDASVLIDPGVAEMQPSYPLPVEEKLRLREVAMEEIRQRASRADYVVISHYHYDHHVLPKRDGDIYAGKTLWVKDPNKWINESQWKRARLFFSQLLEIRGEVLEDHLAESQEVEIGDPLSELPLASSKDYGDYAPRKRELLRKGMRWLEKLGEMWSSNPWLTEVELEDLHIFFGDGRSFEVGATKVSFTKPMFHGVELDRVGWVFATKIECGGVKVIHSSDLQGPMIEDYAEWIVRENPDVLILDGPATYLFGYMLNRINLNRAIENAVRIVEETNADPIVYDHHLPRDKLFVERVKPVYEAAEKVGKRVLTAAELFGRKPLILEIASAQAT